MRIALSCLALLLSSCISDNSAPGSTNGDELTAGGDPSGGDVDPCTNLHDLTTFVPTEERYKTKYDEERLAQRIMYKGQDVGGTFGAPSALRVSSYQGLPNYPQSSGTQYDLSTLDPSAGYGFLVKLDYDCDSQGRFCKVELVGLAGQATVSSIDWDTPVGSTYAGSLTNVEFRQVEYDADELPQEVDGGCVVTLDALSWSGVVSEGGTGE